LALIYSFLIRLVVGTLCLIAAFKRALFAKVFQTEVYYRPESDYYYIKADGFENGLFAKMQGMLKSLPFGICM